MSFPACLLGPGLQPAARPLSWPTSGLYLDDIISLELLGTWTVSVFLGLNLCFYLLKWICLTPPPTHLLPDDTFYLPGHRSRLHRPR